MEGAELRERLSGWKAIAAFLRVDVRTARRWEAERALPVRRLPGDARSPVWADPVELAAWMAAPAAADPEPEALRVPAAVATPASRRGRWRGLAVAGVALLGVGALWLASGGGAGRPGEEGPYGADRAANAAHAAASYARASRTPAGLEEAAVRFSALARDHPDNPAAFVGLADTWLLMREFAGLPDEAAYRRARDAAEAALRLDPDHAEAMRALGFILFWSGADRGRGLELLGKAAERAPGDFRNHHWQGNALAFAGAHDAAFAALARARALNPESPAIAADEAQIRYIMGEGEAAIAALRLITRVHADYIGAWRYLEWDLLSEGDAEGFLEAARAHARLAGRTQRLALLDRAEAALAVGGKPAFFAVLVADAEVRHREMGDGALEVARLCAAAGDRGATLRWLERAVARGEPYVDLLSGWPEFRRLGGDPDFARFSRSAAPSRPLMPAQMPSR